MASPTKTSQEKHAERKSNQPAKEKQLVLAEKEHEPRKNNKNKTAAQKEHSAGKEQAATKTAAAVKSAEVRKPAEKERVKVENKPKRAKKHAYPTPRLSISKPALQSLDLVAVAHSYLERAWFPTDESYEAEAEVIGRAQEVLAVMEKLGVPGRLYPADEHFLTNLIVDRPNLVLNLVDTLRGKDALQTSVPGALEMVEIPYTGAGMRGLVIGNDRNMFKQLLIAAGIPTPDYQFITRANTKVKAELGLPLIVKLNESGGSVGIDNNAVKETLEDAQKQVDELIGTYHVPVIVERFVDGPEVTVVVFEDSRRRHVFMGQKCFGFLPDGKHEFTSLESYRKSDAYTYEPVKDEAMARKIEDYVTKAFTVLHNKDYAKYDVRVDEANGIPYFTDCNPNTAFGPHLGLPFTEILDTLYGLSFEKVLAALLSKYAKKIKNTH